MLVDRVAPKSRGPNRGPKINAEISVLRSRRFSRNSLRNTLRIAGISARVPSCEPFTGADEVHECILQAALSRLRAQFLGRAARYDGAVRDDHYFIAQRGDLLHDVAGEQHTVPFIPQPGEQPSQGADCDDIQTVGRLVQQEIAGPVYQRTRQGGLDLLSLR